MHNSNKDECHPESSQFDLVLNSVCGVYDVTGYCWVGHFGLDSLILSKQCQRKKRQRLLRQVMAGEEADRYLA
jgi:hypothetical protein